jgi:hypothetical protein
MSAVRVFYSDGTTEDVRARYRDEKEEKAEQEYWMTYEVVDGDWLVIYENRRTRYRNWLHEAWTNWSSSRKEVARIRPAVWTRVQAV